LILLTYFSLICLASLLLLVTAFYEVLRSKSPSKAKPRMLFYLGFSALFMMAVFLDNAVYSLGSRPFYVLEYPAILFATIAFAELSRFVAGIEAPKFNRYFSVVVTALTCTWFYGFYTAITSGAFYYSASYSTLLVLPILLLFWSFGLLAFCLYRRTKVIPFRLVSSWKALAKEDDQGKAIYGFFLTSLAFVFGSAGPILRRLTDVPAEAVYGAFFVNNLVILSLMIVTYLTFVERRINLATKLTGILSTMLMVTFVAVVLAFYNDQIDLVDEDKAFLTANSLNFTPAMVSQYEITAAKMEWVEADMLNHAVQSGPVGLDLPFRLHFYGKPYQKLLIFPNGQIQPFHTNIEPATYQPSVGCIRDVPIIAPLCRPGTEMRVSSHVSRDKVIIAWSPLSLAGTVTNERFVQLVISPGGALTFNYGNFSSPSSLLREVGIGVHDGVVGRALENSLLSNLPLLGGDNAPLWFDLNFGRRAYTHQLLVPAAAFLIVAVVVILAIFRPFLARVLVRPLEAISSGLKGVDDGRLDRQLEIRSKDEFSDIAAGFNYMLASLDSARQQADEQTRLLEDEITFRTVEAAKKIDPTILSKDEVFEKKLRKVIGENLEVEDFQVAQLAEAMATSTRQLHRRVVNLTAHTPASLIRSLRLEHAHKLLMSKRESVSQVSNRCGFRDVAYFSKLFLQRYGVSPHDLLNQDPS